MGYKPNNEYIIENDVDETNKEAFEKSMRRPNELPEGYEYDETPKVSANDDGILQSAKDEGLYTEGLLGGEGASPEEVIAALKKEGDSEGTKKIKEDYEEKKIEDLITITATRDLLFNQANETIPVYVKTSVPKKDEETGKVRRVPVKAKFMVKRLTESENTHLLNHKLIGKEISDMTDEEYIDSSHFRSKMLEAAVVEPYLTAEQWRTQVPNGIVNDLYDQVNKVQTSSDDSELFQ